MIVPNLLSSTHKGTISNEIVVVDSSTTRLLKIAKDDAVPIAALDEIAQPWSLSDRQGQVVLLLSARRTNAEIALQLDIAPNTARRHVEMSMLKMGLTSRYDVAAMIRELVWRRRGI